MNLTRRSFCRMVAAAVACPTLPTSPVPDISGYKIALDHAANTGGWLVDADSSKAFDLLRNFGPEPGIIIRQWKLDSMSIGDITA